MSGEKTGEHKLKAACKAALEECSCDFARLALLMCIENLARLSPDTAEDRREKINQTAKSWFTSACKAQSMGDTKRIAEIAKAIEEMKAAGDDNLDDVY